MINEQLEDYYFFKNFSIEWEEICKKLKERDIDLSKIIITCKG